MSLHNPMFAELVLGRSEKATVRLKTAFERAQRGGSDALVARSLRNLARATHALERHEARWQTASR